MKNIYLYDIENFHLVPLLQAEATNIKLITIIKYPFSFLKIFICLEYEWYSTDQSIFYYLFSFIETVHCHELYLEIFQLFIDMDS